jgi:transcriptional regulator with XRE-family HTH domain
MPTERVIRDKGFAKRIADAVESHPHAPSGHGRQKWIREQLEERFNTIVSPEALRKWFAGEAKPRPPVMRQIAQILDVDEAWFYLGITPEEMPIDKRKRNARANGAINYLAGLIQLNGGTIAFPDDSKPSAEHTPDLYAILGGKQHTIEVNLVTPDEDGEFSLTVPAKFEDLVVIAVAETKTPTVFDLIRIPTEVIQASGKRKGGYLTLGMKREDGLYTVGETVLPMIRNPSDLQGKVPRRTPTRPAA